MSLAPARTVSLRSAIDPAVSWRPARNFSQPLRACSKLASAIDRISFGISKPLCPFSLMLPLLLCLQSRFDGIGTGTPDQMLDLTRFPDANRYSLRLKTL